MMVKIRLARKTVQFLDETREGVLRLAGIGSDEEIFEIEQRLILNMDEIDLKSDHFKIVTPENVACGLFGCTTFTREIELPR